MRLVPLRPRVLVLMCPLILLFGASDAQKRAPDSCAASGKHAAVRGHESSGLVLCSSREVPSNYIKSMANW